PELLFSYTLGPLPAQLVLCAGVGVLALPLRHLLFVE
ncbi:MAG TPA: biotin transporter BioY, partial [Prochlorococcaceae cyanobacterium Gl_MAG_24]|nr:biotin transporter BioY [Prochlorococcaceae cyanobacterium Gl_MAG_24]